MGIDLSKIPALELPEKEVTVKTRGGDQTVKIKPLSGEGRFRLIGLNNSEQDNGETTLQRTILMLRECAGMEGTAILKFIELDWKAALSLASECFEFTNEYAAEIRKETEAAEKNSNGADASREVSAP